MTVVTISGLPGTGKTTVARLLQKRLHLKYVYAGKIFRELAEKHGMTLEQFGVHCEEHPEVDRELDDHQVKLLKQGNILLEGRIAGWLAVRNHVPAMKVWLSADPTVRTARIVKRESGDLEKRRREIEERERCEAARYKKYYGIEVNDTSIYDVIVDTSVLTPEQIVDQICAFISKEST